MLAQSRDRIRQSHIYPNRNSYNRQHDAVLGLGLQTNLEQFAKPWYRIRALRIFRDTANLAANPVLWASIEDGLRSSQWFIVLASEDAARSVWVNREVQWWIDHRPLLGQTPWVKGPSEKAIVRE